jgi:hypothetical protein
MSSNNAVQMRFKCGVKSLKKLIERKARSKSGCNRERNKVYSNPT